MRRSWTALPVALSAIFAAIGCNDYGNTFQVPTGASISSLSPANASAGSAQFTLTVVGGGFVAKTVVQWNGGTIATQLQTDSAGNVIGITATVPASLVAKAGTAFVNTLSPFSGAGMNGLSNSLAFIINPPGSPLPAVSSISPTCTVVGGAAFTLTVVGSNFLPTSDPSGGSQILWRAGAGGTPLTGVSVSGTTQIQAMVSNTLISSPGTANVSVVNPPAPQSGTGNGGGGASQNSPAFTIAATSCPAGSARPVAAVRSAAEETPAVSADARFVAYTATQNEHAQIFVRDTCQGATGACQVRTLLVSAGTDGAEGNEDSGSPSMSADGRYIAFSSGATNLLAEAPGGRQIYLRDTCLGAEASCAPSTLLVSTDPQGALVGTEAILPSVSASGRFVAFVAVTPSHANNKSATSTNGSAVTANSGFRQVFVRDTCFGASNCTPKTTRISLQPGDSPATEGKPAGPALSGSGEHVAIPDAKSSTIFGRAVAIDDRIFLALTGKQ
jgi:WD40 repeat protein